MQQVIDDDNELVTSLGWSHTELAGHLENIISLAKKQNIIFWKIVKYEFQRKKKKKFALIPYKYWCTLKVSKKTYMSPQYSLFYNSENGIEKFNTSWNEEYTIENVETGEQ